MTITSSKPDMYVTFRDHIRHGNVWTAEVELSMQDTLDEPAYPLWVVVDVIAPTRELAIQVYEEARWFFKGEDIGLITTFGGMEIRKERKNLLTKN